MGTQIEHPLLGVQFLYPCANGIHQMGLPHSAGSEDEKRIESLLFGMLGNAHAHLAGKAVADACYKVFKILFVVEL